MNRARFVPNSITISRDGLTTDQQLEVTQFMGPNGFGGVLSRRFEISPLPRDLASSVGKSFIVGSVTPGNGPRVGIDYFQNVRPANTERWEAVSGTLIIDAFRVNASNTGQIVTFRLINARFAPFFNARGTFNISLNGTTSGQPNP